MTNQAVVTFSFFLSGDLGELVKPHGPQRAPWSPWGPWGPGGGGVFSRFFLVCWGPRWSGRAPRTRGSTQNRFKQLDFLTFFIRLKVGYKRPFSPSRARLVTLPEFLGSFCIVGNRSLTFLETQLPNCHSFFPRTKLSDVGCP